LRHVDWRTGFRGQVLIHAAKGYPREARAFAERLDMSGLKFGGVPLLTYPLPLGFIIATGVLVDCIPTERVPSQLGAANGWEWSLGDYTPGRWAWVFEQVTKLEKPIPFRGALSMWRVPEELLGPVPVLSNRFGATA
jgi:hypothetical protein